MRDRAVRASVTPGDALDFVRRHGVVLESAAGAVPSLAAEIAGAPVAGRWWTHARGREIFALTRAVRDSPDVLVCRVVDGRISFVHRRLWPALVRVGGRFPREHLAQIRERHTAAGRHARDEVPFPDWAAAQVVAAARELDLDAAHDALGAWSRG